MKMLEPTEGVVNERPNQRGVKRAMLDQVVNVVVHGLETNDQRINDVSVKCVNYSDNPRAGGATEKCDLFAGVIPHHNRVVFTKLEGDIVTSRALTKHGNREAAFSEHCFDLIVANPLTRPDQWVAAPEANR